MSKEKGWLWKQEDGKKSKWNKRFFVLHQSYLEYFESDKVCLSTIDRSMKLLFHHH